MQTRVSFFGKSLHCSNNFFWKFLGGVSVFPVQFPLNLVFFLFLHMFSHFVELRKLKEEIPDTNNTNQLSKFGMHMEE